ncbi:MAG: YneF family protein [Erysipelotrichales bacterium]|nr:YneF family protein [Erysipelotrichales bacterium]
MGWQNIAWMIGGLIIGGAAGFLIARWYLKRELAKNPPVNEKMIRAMFLSMGRKPSESQIKQVMNSMNQYK